MILCDVNVLLYAFRRDAREHEEFHRWLVERLGAAESYGVSELVLSSVIVQVHPRFRPRIGGSLCERQLQGRTRNTLLHIGLYNVIPGCCWGNCRKAAGE